MATWPVRGLRPWDDQLREYIDEGDAGSAEPGEHDHDGAYIPAGDITAIVVLTQAAYDALDPAVATTLYVIQD